VISLYTRCKTKYGVLNPFHDEMFYHKSKGCLFLHYIFIETRKFFEKPQILSMNFEKTTEEV
jgi:hypothetical protein